MAPRNLTQAIPRRKRRREGLTVFPCRWLVTDETRLADPLPAISALPPGSGVIFRHYGLSQKEREQLARTVIRLGRRQRLVVLVAGDPALALRCGADGLHVPEALSRPRRRPKRNWLVTAAAHGRGALSKARRCRVDAALLSPVFPTASHPEARTIGPTRFGLWTRALRYPVLALGGMNAGTARHLAPRPNFAGFAAIAAWRT
ncbi:MAG: thiamine phosphate synthase [Alphaproteobacteria bacterium]|nr:thiamine phosphate synthase [Alphaproteobacteria bacterium]